MHLKSYKIKHKQKYMGQKLNFKLTKKHATDNRVILDKA